MNAHITGVVDYGAGNLKSVETALRFLGYDFFISADPADFKKAGKLIFPGVGDARAAMSRLSDSGLGEVIREFHETGKPILGICLGCQIILSSSEEGDAACLDIVKGKAVRFPALPGFKVPHMGWNQVAYENPHPLFDGIPENSSFYFVHSYYPEPEDAKQVCGKTGYAVRFCSAIQDDNLFAVQFHPEKSGKKGLKLLDNFLNWKI